MNTAKIFRIMVRANDPDSSVIDLLDINSFAAAHDYDEAHNVEVYCFYYPDYVPNFLLDKLENSEMEYSLGLVPHFYA